MKINQFSPQDNEFTQIIDSIVLMPKRLYYIGTLPEKRRPTIAIVGTRKPTAYGREVTTQIATDLARRGVIIVSGMALGVDGLAHRAALDVGGDHRRPGQRIGAALSCVAPPTGHGYYC